jgi:serine/threonine-protein kinase
MSDLPVEGRPTLPSHWQELSPLLDAVLDAAPADRTALILRLSAGDAVRQRALTDLLAECERATPLLDRLAAERFDGLATEAPGSLLPERLGDRYRIGRELGRGGMARVYLARDEKHGRDVAIKVIRPELSASLGHERFLREIEIAARLRHPNIVPLYDSGNIDGSLYFVMPYEEGLSLRERLAQGGGLPLPETMTILRDVARALAYAHEHGVVHRDVKPDNVMLSGGAAVVTDFGIAKAVSAALRDESSPTLTQTGSGIGTPAYMAPEQATGDPSIDHRADIYSFGCLAYELFAGNPPFHSLSMHLIVAAHITTVPPRVTEVRAEVPPGVAALLARCLEKDPADRPQTAREVLEALDGPAAMGSGATPPIIAKRRPAGARAWIGGALALAIIGTAAYVWTRPPADAVPITLSVLPFGNIGADSAIEFVAGGLADEVAEALTRVPGIQVKSRNGARAYRGQLTPDLTEAGLRLKAEYLLTGVVRQDRGGWILSAELTRGADGTSLWAESFNLSRDQQAGAAEAIAGNLTSALRSQFPDAVGSAPRLAASQQTRNPEAYRLDLRGQEKLDRRGQSVRESADLFRQAIHLDTLYARAYSGLSMALALFPYFQGVPAREVREEVIRSAGRAIQLDSGLAQPHVALGLVHRFTHKWDSSAAAFATAIRLDERHIEARVQYARLLLFLGRHGEGMAQLRAARAVDPASALVLGWMGYGYFLDGRMDSALVESARALENDSTNMSSVGLRARVLLGNNHLAEARRLSDRAGSWDKLYVIAKSGDHTEARRRLQELDDQSPQPWLAESIRAYAYLGLGDTARALSALERATSDGEIWPSLYGLNDPIYAPVRATPRFQTLLRTVGLVR